MAVIDSTQTPGQIRRLLGVLAVLAVLVTACSGDFDTAETASDAADAAEESVDDAMDDAAGTTANEATADAEASVITNSAQNTDAPATAEPGTNSSGQTPPTLTAAQRGREIIYTASVSVGVDDVEAAGAQAAQIIADVGGFVASQNTTGGAEPRSQITFKVDPENFSVALERLAGIGELRNQTVSSDDVTERVVDLSSRIEVTQLGVDRLREAMENATDLEDFARLEELLLSRESDLEVMRGTLATLRDQIDLATITVVLEQDRVTNNLAFFVTAYEGHDEGVGCPGTRIDSRSFEPGDEVTLCFDARNDGDQTLTAVTVTETVLGIEGNNDLITVFGDGDDLRPGQSFIQAYELDIERSQNLRLNVTGTPTNGDSADPAGPTVRSSGTPVVRVNQDAIDPGFGDGVGAAVSLLSAIWVAVKVASGFLIPLLVLVPVLVLLVMGVRRLRSTRRSRKQAKRLANQPPPPHVDREPAPEPAAAVAGGTSTDESE